VESALERKKLAEAIHGVVAIHFTFNEQKCWVMPEGWRFRKYALQNPLENYIDQVTQQKILIPAVSPDFYLLDYMTWCKVHEEDSQNPFTRSHFNMRQLTFVTYDNVQELAPKIVNLNESRPKNPADDRLADFLGKEISTNAVVDE
jgi:hypothetical protein